MSPVRLADDRCGLLFDQLDVGHQRRPGVSAFQQVVAENEILRKTPFDRGAKSVDVVDPLADERAFSEQVLVDVRDFARVGINPRFSGDQA